MKKKKLNGGTEQSLSHMWVCIHIEKESRRTSHFGKSLEMGIASGSHFLTPRSLRRPRKEPFFFLYFLSEIHNATFKCTFITDLLPTQVWFRWCIVRLRFHCFRFLLVRSNGCSIKWSSTNFLPKFGRVRTHILSFLGFFLFSFGLIVLIGCYVSPRAKLLISCRKVLFFNGFSLKIFFFWDNYTFKGR